MDELEKVCEWLYIEVDGYYETSCGHQYHWRIEDIDDYTACPYCGKEKCFEENNE